MNSILIDCSLFISEEEMHAILSERLRFPKYYGGNLDALNDCLKGWNHNEHIVLYNLSKACETLGVEKIITLLSVFIYATGAEGGMIFCMGALTDCPNLC